MSLLDELGYTRVTHFPGGVQAWKDAGLRVEHGIPAPALSPTPAPISRRPVRIRRDRWVAFVDLFERRTTADLVWLWLGTIGLCSLFYWLLARAGSGALLEGGTPIPTGALRALASAEAVAGVVLFGALVSKILSRRQEEVMNEIHQIAFEDRLERVQSDLHLALIELQNITQLCRTPDVPEEQVRARVDSASGICLAELRTIHALLYRPQDTPGEAMLEGILASLAGVMQELRDLVACLSSRSPYLTRNIESLTRMAEEICADCVPRRYATNLGEWMNRIQSIARELR